MSRYYTKSNQYYNNEGAVVENPDLSEWDGPTPRDIDPRAQANILKDWGILVPLDFVHDIFYAPERVRRIVIRMELCCYDHPEEDTIGADGSDGLKIDEEELKNKIHQVSSL